MANKKTKNKKKSSRLKKTSAKENKPVRKALRNKPAKKKTPKKKKTALKASAAGKKKPGTAKTIVARKRLRVEARSLDSEVFTPGRSPRPESQSGDLQGLSEVAAADSESVDELLEEGNAFEADVVSGVERAGNENGKEVRTHEVPEDDVPGEYLDQDKD
jgi:hypothetical protein